MKVVSTRVSDELYNALQEFSNHNQENISKILAKAIQGTIQGKVRLAPLGGKDICPVCGHQVHLIQNGKKLYFVCFHCDWIGYLGTYSFPEKIQDLRKEG